MNLQNNLATVVRAGTNNPAIATAHPDCELHLGDNLNILEQMPDGSVDLIYIDPPFNTGKPQTYKRIKTQADTNGDRKGFGGRTYTTQTLSESSYDDVFDNFKDFLVPRLHQAHRLLKANGSFFLHIDHREAHYCKIWLDEIFGRQQFMNEIIWAYDYGARSKNRWSAKHDTIFWYVKDQKNYTFNYDAIDRIAYLSPGLVDEAKALRGKTPTDVWEQTIVPTNSKERTGYPTQKPLAILTRIVKVHSNPGNLILDFFAGSGTTGIAALLNHRKTILIDNNPKAVEVIKQRVKTVVDANQNELQSHKSSQTFSDLFVQELHAICPICLSLDEDNWKSIFLFLKREPRPARKNKWIKNTICNALGKEGLNTKLAKRTITIDLCRCIVKFSLPWSGSSNYRFQQIRKRAKYDFLICLGVHQGGVNLWIATQDAINKKWNDLKGQHTGGSSQETKWISVGINGKTDQNEILSGGDMNAGFAILVEEIKKRSRDLFKD